MVESPFPYYCIRCFFHPPDGTRGGGGSIGRTAAGCWPTVGALPSWNVDSDCDGEPQFYFTYVANGFSDTLPSLGDAIPHRCESRATRTHAATATATPTAPSPPTSGHLGCGFIAGSDALHG